MTQVILLILVFVFTAVMGLLATWVDRKVSARLQYRQGPPWFQPFADLAKLLGKETIITEGVPRWVFFGAPLVGLAGVTLAAAMLLSGQIGFVGDIIVLIYLLSLPSLAIIIGGFAARNPLSAIGASREMKLILAYELPFILAVFTVVFKSKSIILGQIAGPGILSLSGLISFSVALLVVQAKLGLAPFDIAEAEQELAAGPLFEYSGPALAVFRLTRAMLYFVLPVLLIVLFLGGIDLSVWAVIKYVAILVLIILIKNTNPRLRTDQALRFFWGPVTCLAAAGFILAGLGL